MMTSDPISSAAQSPYLLLKQLREKFAVFRDCKPLAIGIDKQLMALLPELNRKVMRNALAIHTNSLQYLKKMEKGTVRFDLDGSTTDEVTQIHRSHAAQIVRERFQKKVAQRKLQHEAEEAQRQAEEAARQRAEKLTRLTAKFSRTKTQSLG
jgi:ProP effector